MALSSEQIAWTARIVRETKTAVASAVTSLSADEEDILSDDIDLWRSIENSYVRYKGEGVDFDNERKRAGIFYRVREMLGFPFIVYEYNALTLELVELELGQNFG
jgi:hypothetical protein